MKYVSLFSGIGGFDEAFRRAGMKCDSVCEIDKAAQMILTRHFPEARLFDDVRKVGKDTHERKSIDVICGGFPCQDLSVAGKRAGLVGERSGLWFEFARVIDELEPRWVVIENVPGLLSSNKGKDFAVIIQWLAQRGYGVTWRVLDAQYFGVPQRRRRVFIVGSFGNGRAAEVLFESESGAGDYPQSREAGKDIAYSLRRNPSHSGDKGDGGINTTLIAPTLSASAGGLNRPAGQGNELDFLVPSRTIAETLKPNDRGLGGGKTSRSTPNLVCFDANRDGLTYDENIAPTLKHGGDGKKAHGQANAEIVNDGSPSLTNNHEQPILFEQVWDSAQITSKEHGSKPSEISQPLNTLAGMMVGVRRLTPTECERLQGFPDGWTDGQSDSARYRQLGNAVAVPVVEWIGKRIVKAETRITLLAQDGGDSPALPA